MAAVLEYVSGVANGPENDANEVVLQCPERGTALPERL